MSLFAMLELIYGVLLLTPEGFCPLLEQSKPPHFAAFQTLTNKVYQKSSETVQGKGTKPFGVNKLSSRFH